MEKIEKAFDEWLKELMPLTYLAVKQLRALRYGSLYGFYPNGWRSSLAEDLLERIKLFTGIGDEFYYEVDSGGIVINPDDAEEELIVLSTKLFLFHYN